jgi:predicted dehydrogenase
MHRRDFLYCALASAAASPSFADDSTTKTWRVGVVGHTGRGDYGHGLHTAWLKVPTAKIVGLADPDDKGRVSTQRLLGVDAGFTDYRQMLKQLRPEIVAVCPRHVDQHHEMILAAIDSGAVGIYCEKPFCRTPKEADEIVDACARSGAKLAIAHRNRYHPAFVVAKAAVQDGAIGKLLELRCRGKEDHRGGAQDLWVLGTHLLNLAYEFSSGVIACSAVILSNNLSSTPADRVEGAEGLGLLAGDQLHARYDTQAGVPIYFDSIRNAGVRDAGFGLQLIGTKGIFDFRIDAEQLGHFIPGNPFQPTQTPRPWLRISSVGIDKPEPIDGLKELVANHTLAIEDLLSAIENDRKPLCSAEDGRSTVEMVHAVFASHVAGGQGVPLPLVDRAHPFESWKFR